METEHSELKWYAAKAVRERPYVFKYLEHEGLETARIADVPSLVFIHCTPRRIFDLKSELYDRMMVYRRAGGKEPEPVPDKVMKSFMILAPYHDQPVIYLPVDSPEFFSGPRKRVISGVFAGCEGVIRRIKGDRRLIIRINDHAAIATPFIHPSLLEDVEA